MAGVIENYSNFEVRAVVKYFLADGVSESEIQCRLMSVHGQKVLSREKCVCVVQECKDGRSACNDPEKHRGRPRPSHTDENCVTVDGLIKGDRGVKVSEKHYKQQLYNTLHPFEGNTALKEC
jgi:hypothetical protein